MVLLVSDSSILIDLERGDLLELAFRYRHKMVVPDLLYERELKNYNGPHLLKLGLEVTHLNDAETSYAQQLYGLPRGGLSLPDCFAFSCGRRPGHVLLTGDRALRARAKAEGMTNHGLLWLLDCLLQDDNSIRSALCLGIVKIISHPTCRLPHAEVAKRRAIWCK